MDGLWVSWLAGLVDGDGHFSISLMKQHNGKTSRLAVTPQIGITLKDGDHWLLREIQKELGCGKLYCRKGNRPGRPIWSWQSTNLKDGLAVSELLYPYLKLKKEKCRKFMEIVKYWISTANPNGAYIEKRLAGQKLRTYSDMMKIIEVAYGLNSDRQTERYKDKMKPEEWKPLIKKWYP